ncbi:MAG: diguanylate cyclase [Alphaproteobacteria bacterium]|nr:diguanylate cyclase [Alphaproteobacteria bacterium]
MSDTADQAEEKGDAASHVLAANAFAGFGEPIIEVATDSSLSALNPTAEGFLKGLGENDVAHIARAATTAVERNCPLVEQIEVSGTAGSQSLQLTIMPLEDGRAAVLVRDTTLEASLRLALVDSRQRYKDFVEISTDFSWETNADHKFAFVSPRGALGYTADALIMIDPADLVTEFSSGGNIPFLTERRMENSEAWLKRADGRSACVVISAMPLLTPDGSWRGARGVCRDVTESREREATLSRVRNRERVLTGIVRSFRDEVNPENMLAAAAETLGRGLGAESCKIFRLASPDAQASESPDGSSFQLAGSFGKADDDSDDSVLASLADGAGTAEMAKGSWQILAAPAQYQGQLNGAAMLWRHVERGPWNDDDRLLIGDIANQIGVTIEQLVHHERIVRISRTDAMTGLLNRGAFLEALTRQLNHLRREPGDAALMYVDLDNFKAVNDTKGHQAGDEALLKLRDILVQQTRPTDLVSRLGGDEFAVFLSGANKEIAEGRATKFLEASEELKEFSGSPDKPLGLSIGLAVLDREEPEPLDELLARADSAMYEAKRSGKGQFAFAPLPGELAAS